MSDDFFDSEAEKFLNQYDEEPKEESEEFDILEKLNEDELQNEDDELEDDFSFNKSTLKIGQVLEKLPNQDTDLTTNSVKNRLDKGNFKNEYSNIEFSYDAFSKDIDAQYLKDFDTKKIQTQYLYSWVNPDPIIFNTELDLDQPDIIEEEDYLDELGEDYNRVKLSEDELNMALKIQKVLNDDYQEVDDKLTEKVEQHPDVDKKKLYEWQQKAIDYFNEKNGVALYEVATGAGKTHLAIQLIKQMIQKEKLLVLIVVPKNVILTEGWLKSLKESGINEKEIGLFYGSRREINTITLTNMQSIGKVPVQMFNMIVLDEAHNYTSSRLVQILRKGQFKYRIGLTATLYENDFRHKLMKIYFKNNVFKYDITKAIKDDIINNFKFITYKISVDNDTFDSYEKLSDEIGNLYSSYGSLFSMQLKEPEQYRRLMYLITQRKKLIANYFGKFKVVQRIIEQNRFKKIIVFNEFNQQTSALYWHLIEKNIEAKVIHSGVPQKAREQLIKDYQDDKFNILLVTKIFDEGYNLPSIDVGIIMSGESTDRQFIQRMGRVLRKKDYLSEIYYIYCANTFEEEYYKKRVKDVSKYAKQVINKDENFKNLV